MDKKKTALPVAQRVRECRKRMHALGFKIKSFWVKQQSQYNCPVTKKDFLIELSKLMVSFSDEKKSEVYKYLLQIAEGQAAIES